MIGNDVPALVRTAKELQQYPIAAAYTQLTRTLGYRPMHDEHLVEALARAGHQEAAATQRRLGDDLETLMTAVRAQTSSRALCLSGGLFFNTSFTTRAASSGVFERTYVPPHPGRNGAAMGAALLLAGARGASGASGAGAAVGSPYLGPSYSDVEIKATLENCKLSFDLLHEERLLDVVLHALSRGRLVGWYHERLEWGPRALGHRSVLADPFAPHVLENLNGFLKRRPSYRTYGVSLPRRDLNRYFEVPQASGAESSPFMQFEYRPRDPEKFRPVLPEGVQTIRVHTVEENEPKFLRLLELWGERTGAPVLVNTSFNGFHEPLVCSPRDAIRVFYGTGLDVLALENFYLHK
jgi:carbamoyltransferase